MDVLSQILKDLASLATTKLLAAILAAVLVVAVGKILLRLLRRSVGKTKMDTTLQKFLISAVKVVIYFVAAMIVAGSLGFEMSSLVALASVVSAAFALAASDTLSNLFGGILLLMTKPFGVNDYVSISGQEGTVQEVGLLNTKINTADNKRITMPNSSIASAVVINYSVEGRRRVDLTFRVGIENDMERVKTAIRATAENHEKVIDKDKIFVRVSGYQDSAASYLLQAWCLTRDYTQVYYDLMEQVKHTFDQVGITMAIQDRGFWLEQKTCVCKKQGRAALCGVPLLYFRAASDQPGHVLGQRGAEMQTLAGDRVVEGEAAGVQRRPADEGRLFGPVEKVAGQRMAQPGHMYPDLVGASGLRPDVEQAAAVASPQRPVAGDRPFAVRAHLPLQYGTLPAADGGVDAPLQLLRYPLAHRQVFLLEPAALQGLPQQLGGEGVLGHAHQPAGAPVQSVDRPEQVVLAAGFIVPGEQIPQGVPVVSRPGVDGHTRRLVQNDQVVVLIEHLQRPGHRRNLGGRVLGQADGQHFGPFRRAVEGNALTIQQYTVLACTQFLEPEGGEAQIFPQNTGERR